MVHRFQLHPPQMVDFSESLTKEEIEYLCTNSDIKYLQTNSIPNIDTLKKINDILFCVRPDISFRLYGHYQGVCDLSFLNQIGNVQNLVINCLYKSKNAEYIRGLQKLKSLSVGIYDLESFDFFYDLPDSIENIGLEPTKSKKPSLKPLQRFKNLRVLYLESQQNDIEVISSLKMIEDITLRSITEKDISFLRVLPKLWSLDIKLGRRPDISVLSGLENLKYLELWQIAGLSDISAISTLKGLQYLFLQSLSKIEIFPDIKNLKLLRRIYLENMKRLKSVSNLFASTSLEEFAHVSATNFSPIDYFPLLEMPSIKEIFVGFGSMKKNNEFLTRAILKEKSEWKRGKFEYI